MTTIGLRQQIVSFRDPTTNAGRPGANAVAETIPAGQSTEVLLEIPAAAGLGSLVTPLISGSSSGGTSGASTGGGTSASGSASGGTAAPAPTAASSGPAATSGEPTAARAKQAGVKVTSFVATVKRGQLAVKVKPSCNRCVGTLHLKLKGRWTTRPLRRSGGYLVTRATGLPRGRVGLYVTLVDKATGRRATSSWKRVYVP
jgi:hypothetical protein